MVRYGGFFASVGGARVLGTLITSVTFPILVRRLGVETYGLWSYVVALCAFFDVVANPGLISHVTQQVATRRHAAAELIPDFLALRFLSTIVAVIALLVLASFEHRPEVRSLLYWYGIGSLFVGLVGADFLLTSLELFHARSLLSLIQQALYAAGVLILVRSPKDIIWVPASILGSALISNLATWVVLWWKGFKVPFVIAPSRWWGILVPSFHYAVSTLMGTVYHRTGHLVVRWFLGDYALGLYAAAVRFVDLLRNFVNIGLNVLMPRIAISGQSAAGLRRLVSAAVSVLAAVSIPLSLGTLATAHLIVPWVLGANYAAAVGPVRWMAGYMVAAPIASLLSGTVLYALGKYRSYMTSSAVGALVAVLSSLILVRVLGLAGVCIAFILAEIAVGASAYLLIPRSLRDFWKNPFIAVAGASGLLMIGAVRVMNSYSSRPVLIVPAGAVVYLIALAILGRKILIEQFGGTT
jgi:PST family polysaccharide transporter